MLHICCKGSLRSYDSLAADGPLNSRVIIRLSRSRLRSRISFSASTMSLTLLILLLVRTLTRPCRSPVFSSNPITSSLISGICVHSDRLLLILEVIHLGRGRGIVLLLLFRTTNSSNQLWKLFNGSLWGRYSRIKAWLIWVTWSILLWTICQSHWLVMVRRLLDCQEIGFVVGELLTRIALFVLHQIHVGLSNATFGVTKHIIHLLLLLEVRRRLGRCLVLTTFGSEIVEQDGLRIYVFLC